MSSIQAIATRPAKGLMPALAVCSLVWLQTASALATTPRIPWHASLADAKASAVISQRPVLAIFIASWSAESQAVEHATRNSPEAAALIASCFEPVIIDVDTQPETATRLNVEHVPTACIIGPGDRVTTRFECPTDPAAFVTSLGRGLQAAAAPPARMAAAVEPNAVPVVASSRSAFSDFSTTATALASPTVGLPNTTASVAAVADKVRGLSRFASSEEAPALPTPSRTTPVAQPLEAAVQVVATETAASPPVLRPWDMPAASTSHPLQPSLQAPPQMMATPTGAVPAAPGGVSPAPATAVWPGTASRFATMEPAVGTPASSAASTPLAVGPALIEPVTTQVPAAVGATQAAATPWLVPQAAMAPNAPPQAIAPQPQQAPQTQQTAVAATANYGNPTPPQANEPQAAAAPGSATSDTSPPVSTFLAGLQKPFNALRGQPAAEPSTMPQPERAPAPPATSMPLGLEGYCPVTLAETGSWVEGQAQWGARHRGRTYLFAGEAQQRTFLADPDRFAPALSGDDPVIAFDTGRTTPGERRFGVTYQSRVYLFSTPETRAAFSANPQRYTTRVAVAEQRGLGAGTIIR